jgi:hypothetical protein
MMNRGKRSLAPWQARWVALHDDLHLLEVLLENIAPTPETTIAYWELASQVIGYGEDLREAYDREVLAEGSSPNDIAYLGMRRRLRTMQARAQELSLASEGD